MRANRGSRSGSGSGLEHRRLFSGRPARGHPAARAQAFLRARISALLFSRAIYGCSVRSASARAESAVHPGDVFEDRAVQLRPCHAEDINQHRPSAGGAEDVGVVQVVAASPERRFPVLRIDAVRCLAYLLELRIAGPGPPSPGELPGDRMVYRSDVFQEDDRAAALEVGGQLDPRPPPVAGVLPALVHECPICRVEREYPRDEGSLRGP